MKKITAVLVLLSVGFMLTGFGNAAPTETIVVSRQGREVTVPLNPQRVIILDFSALDTMHELGLGDKVAGLPRNTMPNFLSRYNDDKYQNIGDVMNYDFEKIKRIKPDLILISGRQEAAYDELAKIAPVLNTSIMSSAYMADFRENTRLLGRLWDKSDEAEALLKSIDDDIAALRQKAEAAQVNGLIVLYNNGKFSAYGSGSRFGIIHEAFGIKPVDEHLKVSNHGQSITSEYILQNDPDYLFVVDRNAIVTGKPSNAGEIENKIIRKTKAYQNGKIVYLSPEHWYLANGGAGSIKHMLAEVATALK